VSNIYLFFLFLFERKRNVSYIFPSFLFQTYKYNIVRDDVDDDDSPSDTLGWHPTVPFWATVGGTILGIILLASLGMFVISQRLRPGYSGETDPLLDGIQTNF
jgi:hypothetical protein